MNTFSEWLVNQREEREWSQNKLAKLMNVSQVAVSRIEAGLIEPTANFCDGVAHALDLPPETVYRAAGILPPKSKRDELIEEAEHLFSQLESEENKQMALNFLRMLQGKKKDNRSPRRSTLVNK